MKLLIAGNGLIGKRHIAHARAMASIDLVGVIDPVAEADFPDLASASVDADALLIATPTDLHAPMAEEAAARGLHLMVEKPLAGTLKDADRIIEASNRAEVQTLMGHHRRHHAAVKRLKELLDGGAIGEPITATLIWAMRKPDAYFKDNWRAGSDGSPVMINLVHEIDTLRFLFGDVVDVTAMGSNARRGACRVESGVVGLAFVSGVTAAISFSDAAASPWGFEAATGENPNIATTGQDTLFITGASGAIGFPSLTVWGGAADWGEAPSPRREEFEVNIPLVDQLEHFAEVVAGREAPVADAREGRATLDVTLRIEAAASRGLVAV